jgi:hypothetical protein
MVVAKDGGVTLARQKVNTNYAQSFRYLNDSALS